MAAEEGQVIGCHEIDVWAVQLDTAKQSNKLVKISLPFESDKLIRRIVGIVSSVDLELGFRFFFLILCLRLVN